MKGDIDAVRVRNRGVDRPAESIQEGVEFIPTLWGHKTIDDWGKVKKGYCKRVFGPNEYVLPTLGSMNLLCSDEPIQSQPARPSYYVSR